MNIGRARAAVVGVLGVSAVGAAAATMDGSQATTSSGSGDGAGAGEGTGDTSAIGDASGDSVQTAITELTNDPVVPVTELFGALVALGTAFLVAYVGYRCWRDGTDGLRELLTMSRDVIIGVSIVGVFAALTLWGFYQRFEPFESDAPTQAEPGSPGQTAVDSASSSGGIDPAVLVVVVGMVVFVGAVILALNRLNTGETGDDVTDDDGADENESPTGESGAFVPAQSLDDVDPSNEIYRAWLAMASSVDRRTDRTRTPAEVARRAVDTGLDRQAVHTITETFQEVRYGQRPATAARESRARSALDRLDDVEGGAT